MDPPEEIAMLQTPFHRPPRGSSTPAATPPPRTPLASETPPPFHIPVALAIAAAAIVSSTVTMAAMGPLVGSSLFHCSQGLDGLGCAVVSRMVLVWASYLIGGAAGFAVLGLLRVPRALPTALLGGAAMATGWTLVRALASSLPSAVLVAAVGFGLFYSLFQILFTRMPGPLAIHVTVAAAVVFASFFGLMELGDRVDRAQFNRDVDREVAALDFDVYVPADMPGYRFADGELSGMYERTGTRSYAVSLRNDLDRYLILTSFRFDPLAFDPPRDCGWPRPSQVPRLPQPCSEVGETPDHVKVYAATSTTTRETTYYAQVGRGVVTLMDTNTLTPVAQDLAMHIFGSLEKTSAGRLRELQDRVRPS
jgi:hypothetical protein